MATIRTNNMPTEYTELMFHFVSQLEQSLYGELTVFYRDTDDSFSGSISNRGVKFFFTIYEINEQMLNGVSAQDLCKIVLADYRKFLPTRFIKGGTNNETT